jgi:uncharacterized protein YfiM (DUF2279 family)
MPLTPTTSTKHASERRDFRHEDERFVRYENERDNAETATSRRMILSLLLALTLVSAAPKDPWFSQDKPIHATISFTTPFAVNDLLVRVCKLDHTKSTAIALGLTAVACIGKEWIDRKGNGWSWKDLTYDAAGLLGAGTIMIVWRR